MISVMTRGFLLLAAVLSIPFLALADGPKARPETRPATKPAAPVAFDPLAIVNRLPANARGIPGKGWDEFSAGKATEILSGQFVSKQIAVQTRIGPELKRADGGWSLSLFLSQQDANTGDLRQSFFYRSGEGPTIEFPVDEKTAEQLRAMKSGDIAKVLGIVSAVKVEPGQTTENPRGTFTFTLESIQLIGWQRTDESEKHKPVGAMIPLKPIPAGK